MTSPADPKHIFLELGDVIRIIASRDSAIHEQTFYVDYLDDTETKLIHTSTLQEKHMNIENGSFTDPNIENIELISRDDEEGYARQHQLLPDNWISIRFGGEVPTIMNGQITSLEEDMIELTTYPEKQKIYIDFAYKGIPRDLPIEAIYPFAPPEKTPLTVFPQISSLGEEEITESLVDMVEGEEEGPALIQPGIEKQLQEDLLTADDIVFGETLEQITQLVPVAAEERRYAIETQTDDLLNEMLSTIPSSERTKRVLNHIHTMIERYKQLRSMFSKMTAEGEIQIPDTKGAQYKPLVHTLENLKRSFYWLLPLVKNKRKIYDRDLDIEDEDSDITQTTLALAQTEIHDLVQQYKQDTIPDEENKYNFLYQSLHPLLAPFDEHDDNTNVIKRAMVNTHMNVAVANLDNFYSSVFCKEQVRQQRFVIEKYNTGLTHLHLRDIKSSTMMAEIVPLTPNDSMDIMGFMILPEVAVLYSHINLPATSILMKAHLNQLQFNYWSTLTRSTPVHIKTIAENQDSNAHLWQEGEFLGSLQALLFTQTQNFDDRRPDAFRNFLDIMIPKTRILFDLIKKYIRNNTSFLAVIDYLEPFSIYPDDISFKQYQNIVSFVNKNILTLKKSLVKRESIYKSYIHDQPPTPFKNSYLFATLHSHYVRKHIEAILNVYSLRKATTAEFIKTILTADDGRLYTSALAWGEWDLFLPVQIDQLIQTQTEKILGPLEDEDQAKPMPEECKNFTLAKFYLDIADLREDDDTAEVYFDTKYDETRYEIIQEFSTEQATMEPKQFNAFLTEHLIKNAGLSEALARRETAAMIAGKRRVQENDYAYVVNDDYQNVYYVRQRDKWVHVPELNGQKLNKTLFCNLQAPCVSIKKECGNLQINARKIKAQLLEQVMAQYNEEHHISSEDLFKKLKTQFTYYLVNSRRLQSVRWENSILYDRKHIFLGTLLAERDIIMSPNALLRDLILSQNDFVKKQGDIIKFVAEKCRPAMVNADEDRYWFYCLDTNQRLLPSYFKTLADAYYANNYELALAKVVAERGEISDDGDKVVDKYSGYTIRMIEYDEGEGYDESGYKIVSREILEEDIGDILMDMSFKPDTAPKSEREQIIQNIITTMERSLHISLGSENAFIVKNTLDKLAQYLPTEAHYKLLQQKAKQKQRRMGSYKDVVDEAILYFTLAYLLVAIQTSMPTIRTNKTFPGCTRAFKGYPLGGGTDLGAITYIMCAALRLRSKTRPWQRLPRANRSNRLKLIERLVAKMRTLIETQLLTESRIKAKITAKQQYLREEVPIETIAPAFDVKLWLTFLPPLYPIHIIALQQLPKAFENDLIQDVESGSSAQFEKLEALLGRSIYFALHIQELIQRVINKETLLLENLQNEVLMENACCNTGSRNTIHYFIEKEANIVTYNNRIVKLEKMYRSIASLTRPAVIFDPRDTKLIYPPLPDEFSEKTIYTAFIRFCLYNTGMLLDEDTANICGKNASEYKNSDSIQTKIAIMKREGKHYSLAHFRALMAIINRKNIVRISLMPNLLTRRFIFEQKLKNDTFLTRIRHTGLDPFVQIMTDTLDTFDVLLAPGEKGSSGRDSIDNMTVFLDTTVATMMNQTLLPFLHKGQDAEAAVRFLQDLHEWKLRGENIYMSREDETAVTIRNYIEINIMNILHIYPMMILNGVRYDHVNTPSEWKVSALHVRDIQHIIEGEHQNIYRFYDDQALNPILQEVRKASEDLLDLLHLLPFFADLRVGGETDRRRTILNGTLMRKNYTFSVYLCSYYVYR